MIQKCPHCNRDVVFTKNICPACGFESSEEERGESTYMGDEARLGLTPAYIEEMESRLNEAQRRGRLQTGLVIGMLVAPLIALNTVGLFWLRPSFWGVTALAVCAWLGWKLWLGRLYARTALWILAAVSGSLGLGLCVARYRSLNPVQFLAFLVFGAVYLWCAWILLRSQDVPEWLRYQRHELAQRGE